MISGIPTEPNYIPREIVLAKITFEHQEEKQRPVLIISKFSNRAFTPSSKTLICLPITSNLNSDKFMIKINNEDMEENRFLKPSQIICDQIFTIFKTDVLKRIGKVTPTFYGKITTFMKTEIIEID